MNRKRLMDRFVYPIIPGILSTGAFYLAMNILNQIDAYKIDNPQVWTSTFVIACGIISASISIYLFYNVRKVKKQPPVQPESKKDGENKSTIDNSLDTVPSITTSELPYVDYSRFIRDGSFDYHYVLRVSRFDKTQYTLIEPPKQPYCPICRVKILTAFKGPELTSYNCPECKKTYYIATRGDAMLELQRNFIVFSEAKQKGIIK